MIAVLALRQGDFDPAVYLSTADGTKRVGKTEGVLAGFRKDADEWRWQSRPERLAS